MKKPLKASKKPAKKVAKKAPKKAVKRPAELREVLLPEPDEAYPPQGEEYWVKRPVEDSQRDWRLPVPTPTWLDEYWHSAMHPHRDLIIDALKDFGPDNIQVTSVLEVGCNTGPNLNRIEQAFPGIRIGGCDLNAPALEMAEKRLRPGANLKVSSVLSLPFDTKSFNVVLADAVLMYVEPRDIRQALREMDRVAMNGIIIVDWFDESLEGVLKDHHWTRNYTELLKELGYDVFTKKLLKGDWPSPNWQKHGHVFVASK